MIEPLLETFWKPDELTLLAGLHRRGGRKRSLRLDRCRGRIVSRTLATSTRRAGRRWSGAGLPPIELHAARHTFASLMAEAGVPIEDLSEFMGHSTINLTVKTYRHLYPEARRRAADALDAFLAAADTNARLLQLDATQANSP